MNLLRTFSWILLIGATVLSGPNLPAQGLAAMRDILLPVMRRAWTGLGFRSI